jgi:hypothetical protein
MNLEVFRRRYQLPISQLKGAVADNLSNPTHKARLEILILDLERVLDVTEESDLIAHTIFREPVSSREDAERLLRYLQDNGLSFHPDDDPADLADVIFSADEARELRHRMNEIGELAGFDPCEFYLDLQDRDDDPANPIPSSTH